MVFACTLQILLLQIEQFLSISLISSSPYFVYNKKKVGVYPTMHFPLNNYIIVYYTVGIGIFKTRPTTSDVLGFTTLKLNS